MMEPSVVSKTFHVLTLRDCLLCTKKKKKKKYEKEMRHLISDFTIFSFFFCHIRKKQRLEAVPFSPIHLSTSQNPIT